MVVRTVETISSEDLKMMLVAIREAYGYDFTQYAEASIKRRSLYFMNSRTIPTLQELSQMLLQDERLFYACLREKTMKRLATYPFIKVWVAGCATGEEVYSIAILLKEEGLLSRSLIYATDINQHSLHQAKEGIFPMDLMKTYTANYQKSGGQKDFSKYYMAQYSAALFDKSLRNNIVFAPHNLASDQSFNEFQLILCRNVLIYFNQELQNKVMTLFYNSLCTFGILGLGNKESILFTDKQQFFEPIDRKEKVFIKTS